MGVLDISQMGLLEVTALKQGYLDLSSTIASRIVECDARITKLHATDAEPIDIAEDEGDVNDEVDGDDEDKDGSDLADDEGEDGSSENDEDGGDEDNEDQDDVHDGNGSNNDNVEDDGDGSNDNVNDEEDAKDNDEEGAAGQEEEVDSPIGNGNDDEDGEDKEDGRSVAEEGGDDSIHTLDIGQEGNQGTKHGATESALDSNVPISKPVAISTPTPKTEGKKVGGEGMVKCSTLDDVVQTGAANLTRRDDEKGSVMDPSVTIAETLASIKADLSLDDVDDDFQQPMPPTKVYILRSKRKPSSAMLSPYRAFDGTGLVPKLSIAVSGKLKAQSSSESVSATHIDPLDPITLGQLRLEYAICEEGDMDDAEVLSAAAGSHFSLSRADAKSAIFGNAMTTNFVDFYADYLNRKTGSTMSISRWVFTHDFAQGVATLMDWGTTMNTQSEWISEVCDMIEQSKWLNGKTLHNCNFWFLPYVAASKMVLYCVNLKDKKFEFLDASGGKFTPLLKKLGEHVVNFVTQYIDVVLKLNYNWGDFRWRQVTSINSHEDTHGGIVCLNFCELWEGKLLTVWKRTWRGQTYLRSRSAQMV
ncbi:unnamed protein product [Linum trigynum]|uniref:Uncharacterized protein n=1 Tax=Linum trigynum TaxID=586398 RepID=A0AAV2D084_9ROSI